MPRDEIDAALDQNPLLADAAAAQLERQRQAARRVIPEQIVGDEDVVADSSRSPGRPTRSSARAPSARAAARSSRTSSGTGSRAPSRPATSADGRGRRTGGASASTRCRAGSGTSSSSKRAGRSPPVRMIAAARHRAAPGRARRSAARPVRAPRRSPAARARRRRARRRRRPRERNGSGYAAAVWPPTTIGTPGASRADLAREREHVVGLERVHAGDADDAPAACGGAARSSGALKRRSAIVTRWPRASSAAAMYSMPERLDAEERAETEAFVPGNRAQQQDVHGRKREM